MNAVLATYLRELRAYFFSPLAYVVLFFFLVINGFIFIGMVSFLSDPRAQGGSPMTYFIPATGFMSLLILGVALTMRLISEELRSGSIEVLMTAPVTEGQVVAGKYLAVLTFYAFLWLPTLAYPLVISAYEKMDWGPVAAGYFGLLALGAYLLAVGVFASSVTRSQLLAAIITAVLILLLFLLSWFGDVFNGAVTKQVFEYLNLGTHLDEFAKGIVDTRRLVYYGSGTLFFLFLATRALEDRKWR